MICDLHTHSVFSDGTWTPQEVVDGAIAAGLSAVALTDHNTVDGLHNFINAARGKNIEIVTGTEFSVNYNGKELHILGLFISPEKFDDITSLMSIIHKRKEKANRALIDALKADGYELDYDALASVTPTGRINRAHVAGAMVEKGYADSVKDAFYKFLLPSAGYYTPPKMFTAQEIIDFIDSIGAVSVWAHPFLSLSEPEVLKFLSETEGLCGMECYYPTYDEATTKSALEIADRFGLLPSGGSDFHGARKPGIELAVGKGNLEIPYEWYLAFKEKRKQ